MFSSILEVLEYAFEDGASLEQKGDAKQLLAWLLSFDFAFTSTMMKNIFGITNELSSTLQRKNIDIVNITCGVHKVTIRHHYEIQIFKTVIDWMLQELNSRFDEVTIELLSCMACFSPNDPFSSFNKDKLVRLAKFYPSDFSEMDFVYLENELETFCFDMKISVDFNTLKRVECLAVKLVETKKHIVYPLPKYHKPTSKSAMECENYFANESKSVPSSEKSSPCFDCSICLDFAKDPIVTLCGHLFCWPCIYKWLSFQTTSDSGENPLCPVCKSEISHTSVVPLYGRGGKTFSDDDTDTKTAVIPPRPHPTLLSTSNAAAQRFSYRNPHQTPYGSYDPSPEFYGHGVDAYNPNVWMYGEMIYARVFGNSQGLYTFPNSYHLAGSSNPRLRRQEMEVHRSLNRLSFFLFCCFFLCLLLF
ncbi:hypothetical protein OSB04_001989 [Centaurea solstitialis]|uniref:E3 ubiquitin-protein ligase RMA n=1 Tax=Centaurea solstitialis TaxID=347529 RepID=A0AA38TS06_9ASTR|nr:hypothetical protein OSB04_001989 [Centaurea solstitialis]